MRFLLALVLVALTPNLAAAQENTDPETPELSPWDREFAIAGYVTGHTGSYSAGGIGGRVRWEFLDWLGVEAYLEATIVSWEGGFRHDWPNGFSLYVPIRVGDFRVRPFLGICDVLSFAEAPIEDAPRSDDVLLGAHAGVGAEYALFSLASVFFDAQFNGYAGHDRAANGWTGGVGEEFEFVWYLQLNLGVQLHVGER